MAAEWRHLERHLSEALELSPEERSDYLAEHFADQAEARRSLEALLALEEHVESFLETPPVPVPLAPLPSTGRIDLPEGHTVGPYRILRVLGHGGMSTVYLAERIAARRDERVALKVIQPGAHRGEIIRRFIDEQRILAQLDHPNIGRLFDGGTTDGGLPYFVMEAIDGQDIETYCDSHRLTLSERLGLFRQVCAAVHYAHQNLVVHRDIKPSNILVTEDGIPKLLDFGIAKLLSTQPLESAPDPTITSLRAMTPNYASPEQIRGGVITTASDTYSLGVLLYKLTTGCLPYRFPSSLPQEINRVLLEQRVEEPSQRVLATHGEVDFQKIAEHRGVTAEKLSRQLRGDLDNIILMTLRDEPGRRYGSVENLAEDLRRLSAGLPVSARPDTAFYRAGKFLGRHKLGVTFVAFLMLLVMTFGILTAVHSARLEIERRQTDEVADFLISLFETSGSGRQVGESITAREVLQQGAARVQAETDLHPSVRATLLHRIGQALSNLRLFDLALPLFEEALAMRQATLGEDHPQTAVTLHHLGVALWGSGDYAASAEVFERALAKGMKEDRESMAVADTLSGLASLKRDQGDFFGAEEAGRRALDIHRRRLGPNHPKTAQSQVLLAFLLFDLEAYEEAEGLYRQAIESLRERRQDSELAKGLSGLSLLLMFRGDAAAAEPLARESMDLHRQLFGEDHPAFADNVSIMAFIEQELGNLEAAERWQRQSLAILRNHFSDGHPSIARAAYNLSLILSEGGNYEEAETLLRQALAVALERVGGGHVRYANGLVDLAWVLLAKGELEEAEASFREAVEILQRTPLDESNIFIAMAKMGLGSLLSDLGELEEAEELLVAAEVGLVSALGPDHWRVAQVRNELGACLLRRGRIEEATPLVVDNHRLLAGRRGSRSEITRRAARHLAALEAATGE